MTKSGLIVLATVLLAMVSLVPPHAAVAADDDSAMVEVAMLTYGTRNKTSVCFSDKFLRDVAYETGVQVDRDFVDVRLRSEDLFDYPFAIMSGEGTFELTAEEVANVRAYVNGGGFLLASAGCSSSAWNVAMRRAMDRIFPDNELVELEVDHPVFQTVWDITEFESKKRRRTVRVYGIEIEGRLAVVYSPEGLNDTRNAGGSCCCCGGNELRNARYVNANILAYALTK